MIAKLNELSVVFGVHGMKLTFSVDAADEEAVRAFLCDYRIKNEYTVQITEKRPKRSLSANALLWLMAGRIAAVLPLQSKEDVYREFIRKAGVFDCVTVDKDAYDVFVKDWAAKGIGWFTEALSSESQDKIDVACYYGSSMYDSREISRCIDYALDEAKSLGVETLPKEEVDEIKQSWTGKG